MEWRLVVAVLCLIAFTEPTATENVTIAANTTSINATNVNITISAPSAAPVTAVNTTANNNQTANPNQAASTNQTANTTQAANTNQTANTNQAANTSQTTTTAATIVSTPAKLATVNVVFRILQEFKDSYTNLADPETIKLTEDITNAFTPGYRKRFPNFRRMFIRKFSRGSIVADSVFEFDNTNNTSPNVTEVTNVFTDAIKTGNISLPVDAASINSTDITPSAPSAAPVTAENTTANNNQTANTNQAANTNQTTTAAATTVSTPAKLATINVVFRILQEFKDSYSNLSDPETIKLTDNITNAFTPIYRKRFPNFRRMFIRKFSRGSIVADSVFEFDNTNNTSPNVTEVTNVFTDAIKTGNLSLSVDAASVNSTDITPSETTTANTSTTTQAATTLVSIEGFNLTFKMTGDFTNDLSNMSSSVATNLTSAVILQLDKVFKNFANHRRTFVRMFRSGSIAVDAGLEFNKALNSTSPTAATLAKALADGVRSGVVALPIDTKTIQVTDSTGTTANKSPVLASMLTAFWMTLASLLLSAVMH